MIPRGGKRQTDRNPIPLRQCKKFLWNVAPEVDQRSVRPNLDFTPCRLALKHPMMTHSEAQIFSYKFKKIESGLVR